MERLDKYMNKLDRFTPVLNRNLREVKSLDEKVAQLTRSIQQETIVYVRNCNSVTPQQQKHKYNEIHALYREAERLATRKVHISQRMYDTINNYCEEMNRECDVFYEEQDETFKNHNPKILGPRGAGGGRVAPATGGERKRPVERQLSTRDVRPAYPLRSAHLRSAHSRPSPPAAAVVPVPSDAAAAPSIMSMPVNPHEPKYCICKQVSFGEMVMCDQRDCETEWFHFQCVGLKCPPVGKWFCDACTKKKRARK